MKSDFGQFSEESLKLFHEMYSERIDKSKMSCNQPRRLNDGSGQSHIVKACCDECGPNGKLIRFGQKGASTAGKPKKGESNRMKAKRKSFKARHRKNIARGPVSGAYWANKVKW
jgi:hypothetical protein